MNGDIYTFPLMRNETENRNDGYNEFKTPFSHIETIKRHFMTVFAEESIYDILPSLYELDNDNSLRSAILKIILQLFRYSPKEMIIYFKINSPFIGLINNVILNEEIEQKLLTQLGLLILLEIVRYFNSNKVYGFLIFRNALDFGYELVKATNYVNKLLTVSFI